MQLDPASLLILTALGAFGAGVLILGAWAGWGRPRHLLIWAGAHFLAGLDISLSIVAVQTGSLAIFVPAALMMTGIPVLLWAGTRQFLKLSIPPALLFAGPALTILAMFAAPYVRAAPGQWMMIAVCLVWPAYCFAAARDLWASRIDRLMARLPLIVLLVLHGAVFLPGIGWLIGTDTQPPRLPEVMSGFGFLYFETILFLMGSAIAMLILQRERIESAYREETRHDILTGASTRRAFFEAARRMVERCGRDGAPLSLVMFDLDHFKAINDKRGHEAGDRVLRGFADSVRLLLRPADMFGRFGGEEFILLLPDTPLEAAVGIAERIRRAFGENYKTLDGVPLRATVSAGVAGLAPGGNFDETLWEADRALYAAKDGGRNRVRVAGGPDAEKLVRIA